ncbi:MAG: PAS domain S-box protein [Nitrospinae bacterium]|nr:PAS domain S-box protein [Nitrospinota bacterium]
MDQKRDKNIEIEILNHVFQTFNLSTAKLKDSYERLEKKIKELNIELQRKNEELIKNLQEKEEVKNYLNNILESLTTGVMVVTSDGRVTKANRAAGEILGTSLIGKELKDILPPDLLTILFKNSSEISPCGLKLERIFTNKDGDTIYVTIYASPVRDQKGGIIGNALVLQDVTTIKRLEERAERNKRLTAMGEMVAGIAHEIRNPLGSIELFASILKKELSDDEDKKRLVEQISSGVKTLNNIISNTLLFTKSPRPVCQRYDLHTLLDDILLFSYNMIKHNGLRLIKRYDTHQLSGYGDIELLKQVFLNIILNAIQAMPEGGDLIISTRIIGETGDMMDLSSNDIKRGVSDNLSGIMISISDSGCGIPKDYIDRVFDPFFTTKDRGTGLGLAIVHNIVKFHNGSVEVESREGRGTTFTITLPLWSEKDGKEDTYCR